VRPCVSEVECEAYKHDVQFDIYVCASRNRISGLSNLVRIRAEVTRIKSHHGSGDKWLEWRKSANACHLK
jgi:hypothetical protein